MTSTDLHRRLGCHSDVDRARIVPKHFTNEISEQTQSHFANGVAGPSMNRSGSTYEYPPTSPSLPLLP